MKRMIGVGVIIAGVWSLFPWGIAALLSLLGALLPDPGTIISFKVPWWVVGMIWASEPLLLLLLWGSLKSRAVLVALTVSVSAWIGLGLATGLGGLMFCWLGPTLLLLPFLFAQDRRSSSL